MATSDTYKSVHSLVRGTHHYGGGRDTRFGGPNETIVCPAPECRKVVSVHNGTIMMHADQHGFLCDYNGRRPGWQPQVDAAGRLLNDDEEGIGDE